MKRSQFPSRVPAAFAALLLAGAAMAPAGAQAVLFDFGRHDSGTNGQIVSSPATPIGGSGTYYWNSVGGAATDQDASNPTFTGFVDTDNNALAGWSIGGLSSNVASNGFLNGGLIAGADSSPSVDVGINPSAANLGLFAVANATGDYWFSTTSGTFTLSGLDNTKTYDFTFFGSRWGTSARYTTYTVDGAGAPVTSGSLQTTGTDIGLGAASGNGGDTGLYDGNDSFTAAVLGVAPDSGAISIAINAASGGFGYLNAMRVEVIPEPSAASLLALWGAGWAVALRRRR
jgi:hypothetical protein